MICRDFEEKVNLYLDHLVSEQESRQIEAHMEECPSCKNQYLRLKQTIEALNALEEVPLPEEFEAKLREKLAQQAKPRPRRNGRFLGWAVSAAAVMVVAAGLLGMLGSRAALDETPETSAAMAQGSMQNIGYVQPETAVEETGGRETGKATGISAQEDASEGATGAAGAANVTAEELNQDKLIYTGQMTLLSYQFDADLQAVLEHVQQTGGFVDQSTVSGLSFSQSGGQGRTAYLVIRVPQAQYAALGQYLQGIGQVSLQQQAVTNITQQYAETQIRIENLQKQIQRLQELMTSAQKVEDLISLEAQLTDVTSQLEIYESQLSSMDTQVAYSTLTVILTEMPTAADTTPTASRGFGQRMADALRQGWNSFVLGLQQWTLGLVRALPGLVLVAVILGVAIVLVWLLRRKKNKK